MKHLIHLVIIILLACQSTQGTPCIVPQKHSGRFGDQLILYADAKYASYKTGIPLALPSFVHSQALWLDTYELPYQEDCFKEYEYQLVENIEHLIKAQEASDCSPKQNIVYQPRYRGPGNLPRYRNDPYFLEILRKTIQLKTPLSLEKPDKENNTMNVAVHIRKGTRRHDYAAQQHSVFDQLLDGSVILPFGGKFLPDSYYLKYIRWFATQFPQKTIEFFLFTDHDNPQELLTHYAKQLQDLKNITLRAKQNSSQTEDDILIDFFSLLEFDNLIRSNSSFALVAQLIGNYEIVIAPRAVCSGHEYHCLLLPDDHIIRENNHARDIK